MAIASKTAKGTDTELDMDPNTPDEILDEVLNVLWDLNCNSAWQRRKMRSVVLAAEAIF